MFASLLRRQVFKALNSRSILFTWLYRYVLCFAAWLAVSTMSEELGYSPSFKRPSDIMRMRRKRARSEAFSSSPSSDTGGTEQSASSPSSSCVRPFSPGPLFFNNHNRGVKRRNPFANIDSRRSPRKKRNPGGKGDDEAGRDFTTKRADLAFSELLSKVEDTGRQENDKQVIEPRHTFFMRPISRHTNRQNVTRNVYGYTLVLIYSQTYSCALPYKSSSFVNRKYQDVCPHWNGNAINTFQPLIPHKTPTEMISTWKIALYSIALHETTQ